LNNGGFLAHLIDWEIEMMKKPETSKDAADKLVKNIRRKIRQSYSAEEKIRRVEGSHLPTRKALDMLGIPRTTVYRPLSVIACDHLPGNSKKILLTSRLSAGAGIPSARSSTTTAVTSSSRCPAVVCKANGERGKLCTN
jgi:hypothetical protein